MARALQRTAQRASLNGRRQLKFRNTRLETKLQKPPRPSRMKRIRNWLVHCLMAGHPARIDINSDPVTGRCPPGKE